MSLKSVVEDSGIVNFYSEENQKNSNENIEVKEITTSFPQDLIDKGFSQIENEVKND